ncbi:MAG: DUF177 domain-containing protein, partial [bacterium]
GKESAGLEDIHDDVEIDKLNPVHYNVLAQLVSGRLIVRGVLKTTASLLCARCAQIFDKRITEQDFMAEQEIVDPNQPVDLTSEVRESILLALPSKPLCRVTCRGLCPRCGGNLNQGACRCPPAAIPCGGAFDGLTLQ